MMTMGLTAEVTSRNPCGFRESLASYEQDSHTIPRRTLLPVDPRTITASFHLFGLDTRRLRVWLLYPSPSCGVCGRLKKSFCINRLVT